MIDIMNTELLAQRLKRLRTAKDMSVADLATASGLSKPYIWQIEDGRRKTPSGVKLLKLASALGTTVGALLGAEEGISAQELADVSPALQKFVNARGKVHGIRSEDIAMLQGCHYRGKRPSTAEDYELLFLFLRRLISRP